MPVNSHKFLDVTTQPQQQMAWCWAAVGTFCALYFDSKSGWTQCKIVNDCLTLTETDCCGKAAASPKCDKTFYLENSKEQGSFVLTKIANGYQDSCISYSDLIKNIDADLPIAFRIELSPYFAHFIVVSGYDNTGGKEFVKINDSFFGDSEIPYSEFVSKYQHVGKVTHTFFQKTDTA